MKICLSNQGIFSSIKTNITSDQVSREACYFLNTVRKNYLILISAQLLYLHLLHKVRNKNSTPWRTHRVTFLQQAAYWENQCLSFYLPFPPSWIK